MARNGECSWRFLPNSSGTARRELALGGPCPALFQRAPQRTHGENTKCPSPLPRQALPLGLHQKAYRKTKNLQVFINWEAAEASTCSGHDGKVCVFVHSLEGTFPP